MTWNTVPPPLFEGEDELQLKLQYARMVARNERERFTAGYKIFAGPENYGRALQVQAWFYDEFVQDEIARLRVGDNDEDPKEQFIRSLEDRARTAKDSDAVKFLELAAEMRGWRNRGSGANININTDNRIVNVLKVPTRDATPADDADFNERFYIQQNALIADAKSNRPQTIEG